MRSEQRTLLKDGQARRLQDRNPLKHITLIQKSADATHYKTANTETQHDSGEVIRKTKATTRDQKRCLRSALVLTESPSLLRERRKGGNFSVTSKKDEPHQLNETTTRSSQTMSVRSERSPLTSEDLSVHENVSNVHTCARTRC